MSTAEIELKFPLLDPAALSGQLPPLGFHLVTPRTFEVNTLYDSDDRALRDVRQLLRIRKYGTLWTVTHKRAPDTSLGLFGRINELTSRYKVRYETETTLADGEQLAAIFEHLGYHPVFRYEKFRAEWSDNTGHIVIDETPIGTWAEAEGPTAWIDSILTSLGVDQSTCSTESYGRLFTQWKERTGSPARNLTFEEIGDPTTALEAEAAAS